MSDKNSSLAKTLKMELEITDLHVKLKQLESEKVALAEKLVTQQNQHSLEILNLQTKIQQSETKIIELQSENEEWHRKWVHDNADVLEGRVTRLENALQRSTAALILSHQTSSKAEEEMESLASREQKLVEEVIKFKHKHQILAKKLIQLSLRIPLYAKGIQDVQGSTRQWEANAPVMAKALTIHNDLIRKKIRDLDGYEVKTEGDSFIDPLQELMKADWPEDTLSLRDSLEIRNKKNSHLLYRGLRVRMGVHKGEPSCVEDPVTGRMDYFGPVVNRAARVERIANGGQILISKEVWKEAVDRQAELGNPIANFMGNIRLSGLETDTEIYQILPLELEERIFPPLMTELKENIHPSSISDQIQQISEENQNLSQTLTGMKSLLEESREKARGLVEWMKLNNVPETEMTLVLSEMSRLVEEQERNGIISPEEAGNLRKSSFLKDDLLKIQESTTKIPENSSATLQKHMEPKPTELRPTEQQKLPEPQFKPVEPLRTPQPPALLSSKSENKSLNSMELHISRLLVELRLPKLPIRRTANNVFLIGDKKITLLNNGSSISVYHPNRSLELSEWLSQNFPKRPITATSANPKQARALPKLQKMSSFINKQARSNSMPAKSSVHTSYVVL